MQAAGSALKVVHSSYCFLHYSAAQWFLQVAAFFGFKTIIVNYFFYAKIGIMIYEK